MLTHSSVSTVAGTGILTTKYSTNFTQLYYTIRRRRPGPVTQQVLTLYILKVFNYPWVSYEVKKSRKESGSST